MATGYIIMMLLLFILTSLNVLNFYLLFGAKVSLLVCFFEVISQSVFICEEILKVVSLCYTINARKLPSCTMHFKFDAHHKDNGNDNKYEGS